ncbi:hypothetical protein G6F63_015279 [Rhizopus arrhizus]|nr:hypothetical protein G6F63_015279 [Rhizopus arrhizus]
MTDIPQPRKSPRQLRSQHTVDTILQATARVLAANGYAGTNTNLIAETAGVSVGSLVQCFPHKNALIAALHQRHDNEMLDVIDNVLNSNPAATLEERVAAIVQAIRGVAVIPEFLYDAPEQMADLFRRMWPIDWAYYPDGAPSCPSSWPCRWACLRPTT